MFVGREFQVFVVMLLSGALAAAFLANDEQFFVWPTTIIFAFSAGLLVSHAIIILLTHFWKRP